MSFLIIFGQILLLFIGLGVFLGVVFIFIDRVSNGYWHPLALLCIPILFAAGTAFLVMTSPRHHERVLIEKQESKNVY